MDVTTFDRLARTFATAGTRRTALGALLAGAGTALGLAGGQRAAAQSCTANGERCQDDTDCCSGRCKPKRHTHQRISVCRQADNQGECTVEKDLCAGSNTHCGTYGDQADLCFCFVTTTGRSFCGASFTIQSSDCDCASNAECEDRIGKGAKCVATGASGFIACQTCREDGGTGCVAPCPNLDPGP